jgi:nickel/cobalt transporter (NiCoT) family protein
MTYRAAGCRIATMMALLIAANAVIWLGAWHRFQAHPGVLGAAFLAWIFGLRHAVDADHIAAIDNVVRKLVQNRRRAWNSGLFFALGHSATVLILCLCVIAVPSFGGTEHLREAAGMWGTLLSACLVLLLGLANALTLARLWRTRRDGPFDRHLAGGAMGRVLRPVQRLVGRSWHMLPVGFLFGLGFDTASEVALLVLTGREAASGLSPSDVLVFPALFAAGMVLIDTADSALMTGAYGWALREPARKLGYNIAVTALSVFVAIGVGGLELLGILVDRGGGVLARIPLLAWLLDALPWLGFVLAALLLAFWGIAVLTWRSRPRLAD